MRKLNLYIFFLFFSLIFYSCSDNITKTDQIKIDDASVNLLSNGEFNFEEYIEGIRTTYQYSDKIIAVNYEFIDNHNIKVKTFHEMDLLEASLGLMFSDIDFTSENTYSKSKGCSKDDISSGECYEVTCHNNGKSTTSRCTFSLIGGCARIGKDCIDAGGCVEACKVPPLVYYIPRTIIEKETNDTLSVDQFHFFPGKE